MSVKQYFDWGGRSSWAHPWLRPCTTRIVDLLLPLSILANFASVFESSLQHSLADFSHNNSLTFLDNFTDIKK